MAKETLTLQLDPHLVDRVRRYSAEHGTDVEATISELIASLPSGVPSTGASAERASADDEQWLRSLSPITRSLYGIGAGDASEEDYKEYLWQKYGSSLPPHGNPPS